MDDPLNMDRCLPECPPPCGAASNRLAYIDASMVVAWPTTGDDPDVGTTADWDSLFTATLSVTHGIPQYDVFESVQVSYLMRGGTRVMWRLNPRLDLPLPWLFQLQYGTHPAGNASWVDVGNLEPNIFYRIDTDRRDFGQRITGFYRVRMIAGAIEYTSRPVSVDGTLSYRDWRIASEILRQEKVRAGYAAQEGYLLRFRSTGNPCSRCLDPQTDEPTDPNCPHCFGTGVQCGYYYPLACVWADMTTADRNLMLDRQLAMGTVDHVVVSARMLMVPPFIGAKDIWVSQRLDQRYEIGKVQHIAEMRGVPLIANVELRLLPYTHPIYAVAIPAQDARITA
jgi:hypothetical protein